MADACKAINSRFSRDGNRVRITVAKPIVPSMAVLTSQADSPRLESDSVAMLLKSMLSSSKEIFLVAIENFWKKEKKQTWSYR